MMSDASVIHPTAIIHPGAELGTGVQVGPYCVIGPQVVIGDGCRLESQVVIDQDTELGPENRVSPMASIGGPPQDLKYAGEPTRLVIGARNTIREFVTLNRGTAGGGGVTRIGGENLFMAYAHIGHDCQIGNRIIFANAATLAGHVEVGDDATIGAYCGVHQFCRVARNAFIGGYSVVTRDALPWVTTVGNRAKSAGLNTVGLQRRGAAPETVKALKRAYKVLFRSKLLLDEALATVERELGDDEEVRYLVEFIRTSKRGVCR
jgi:UDP-N-acetylglucosamine acyltransferase